MSVGLCVKVNGSLMYLDIPKQEEANYVQAGAYYYNGDSRLDQAGKTNWCNVRHPNESVQVAATPAVTRLPEVGSSDLVLPIILAIFITVAAIASGLSARR